jgi:hypothetical protein
MKRKWLLPILIILVLAGTLIVVASVSAITGYSLGWWTVDGGGSASADGGYSLDGTIGQPDAGTSSGDSYTLAGGFWGGEPSPVDYQIFLPLVVR